MPSTRTRLQVGKAYDHISDDSIPAKKLNAIVCQKDSISPIDHRNQDRKLDPHEMDSFKNYSQRFASDAAETENIPLNLSCKRSIDDTLEETPNPKIYVPQIPFNNNSYPIDLNQLEHMNRDSGIDNGVDKNNHTIDPTFKKESPLSTADNFIPKRENNHTNHYANQNIFKPKILDYEENGANIQPPVLRTAYTGRDINQDQNVLNFTKGSDAHRGPVIKHSPNSLDHYYQMPCKRVRIANDIPPNNGVITTLGSGNCVTLPSQPICVNSVGHKSAFEKVLPLKTQMGNVFPGANFKTADIKKDKIISSNNAEFMLSNASIRKFEPVGIKTEEEMSHTDINIPKSNIVKEEPLPNDKQILSSTTIVPKLSPYLASPLSLTSPVKTSPVSPTVTSSNFPAITSSNMAEPTHILKRSSQGFITRTIVPTDVKYPTSFLDGNKNHSVIVASEEVPYKKGDIDATAVTSSWMNSNVSTNNCAAMISGSVSIASNTNLISSNTISVAQNSWPVATLPTSSPANCWVSTTSCTGPPPPAGSEILNSTTQRVSVNMRTFKVCVLSVLFYPLNII